MAPHDSTRVVPAHEEDDIEAMEPRPSLWQTIWQDNKGALLILLSEMVGSSMDAIVRFLQQGGHKIHTFELIVARMGMTFALSTAYMWWTSVPYFPLGNPRVRGWLILRALFGYGGLFCLYYSVHYLPLAEATVFRFLVPIVTAWACSIFLGQPFTRKELIAGLVALVGVLLIAHPESIFGKVGDDATESDPDSTTRTATATANATAAGHPGAIDDVSPAQRLLAIAVAVVGIFGASGAYTTIRIIGDRAHALMSVNYFAFLGASGSAVALAAAPGIGFTAPRGAREWALLLLLGVLGFVLQFLLTAGLQLDKSPKATSMMYTQVLFALAFDWAIWGILPGGWSVLGGAVVIASTLWSALQKGRALSGKVAEAAVVDEETALLGAQAEGVEEARRRASTAGM